MLGLLVAVCAVPLACDDIGDGKALRLQQEAAARQVITPVGDKTVEENLDTVAKSDRLSPAVVQGQHANGQYLVAKANAAAADLAAAEHDASSLIFRIGSVLRQANMTRLDVAGVHGLDPQQQVAAATLFVGNARGGAAGGGNGQATFAVIEKGANGNAVQLPTLASAQQEKSRLDGEIAKTQDSINAFTAQRDQLLTQAGQISGAMDAQSSADRVKSAQSAGDLRRKAADLSRQIAEATNQLTRLQADQAYQVALAAQLNSAIESTDAASKAMQSGWTQLAGVADAQSTAAQNLLKGSGPDSVTTLVAALNDKLKDVASKRESVEASYKAAIDQLDKAANNTASVLQEFTSARTGSGGSTAYEGKAWDDMISLLAPARIVLDKANAERALADSQAGAARLLTDEITTARLFDTVGPAFRIQPMKPFDTAALTTELNKALNAANDSYTAADNTIEGVDLSKTELQPLRPAKATAKVVNLYEQVLLCRLADIGGAGGELPKAADKHLKDAQAAAKDAVVDNSLTLPRLPSEVQVEPKPAATEDTSGAATTPGTDATAAPGTDATATPATGTDAAKPDAAKPDTTPPAGGATPGANQ